MEFEPGLYEVISNVIIRREPRVIEYKNKDGQVVSNQVGRLSVGTQRQVYSVLTDKSNVSWGRISDSDATGNAQWICMKNVNRTFVKLVSQPPTELNLETRLTALEAWARSKGYSG